MLLPPFRAPDQTGHDGQCTEQHHHPDWTHEGDEEAWFDVSPSEEVFSVYNDHAWRAHFDAEDDSVEGCEDEEVSFDFLGLFAVDEVGDVVDFLGEDW